jgi:uncharacterized membrane protein
LRQRFPVVVSRAIVTTLATLSRGRASALSLTWSILSQQICIATTECDERDMREILKQIADFIAMGVESFAALIIAYGAIEAIFGSVRAVSSRRSKTGLRKEVWLRFALWLLLGLEFELAADIVRTAISPTWTDIGQLGAIGVIRTFLNFFLEKDLEKYEPKQTPIEAAEEGTA